MFCYDHVGRTSWKHLNIFNQSCVLQCDLPRAKCRLCGRVSRVKPPWEGRAKHFTTAFEAFALTLMREMPVRKVSQLTQVSDGRIWRMLLAHVEHAYSQLDMSNVSLVGADELNRRKGHHYLTLFCDLDQKRLLFATPGKDATVWPRFAQVLQQHGGHPRKVSHISIDMSPAYKKGVLDDFSHATLIFDKFHLIAHAGDAVDRVRRIEAALDSSRRSLLKDTRWLWLKNPSNLSDPQLQRLNRIDLQALWTAKAYQMKLALQHLYTLPAHRAKRRLLSWCKWVKQASLKAPRNVLKPMLRVALLIEAHLNGILAHWQHRLTNAFLEALSSIFSATKRKARGYRSIKYLTAMLYFSASKLNLPHLVPL
ncbi:MAG: ISL3 family transposase [Verrucomicrobiales bacterium]|nr:ISL3 family transposase [Verrucomicrobiales bacterium]